MLTVDLSTPHPCHLCMMTMGVFVRTGLGRPALSSTSQAVAQLFEHYRQRSLPLQRFLIQDEVKSLPDQHQEGEPCQNHPTQMILQEARQRRERQAGQNKHCGFPVAR